MPETIDPFDRAIGMLHDVALRTKPSTVEFLEPVTGRSETFVIQTFRHAELGDYVSIKRMNDAGVTRLILPPAVTRAVAGQRTRLTARNRSRASRASAQARIEAGTWKGFAKK